MEQFYLDKLEQFFYNKGMLEDIENVLTLKAYDIGGLTADYLYEELCSVSYFDGDIRNQEEALEYLGEHDPSFMESISLLADLTADWGYVSSETMANVLHSHKKQIAFEAIKGDLDYFLDELREPILRIYKDNVSPRDHENYNHGRMVIKHRKYILGDEFDDPDPYNNMNGWSEFIDAYLKHNYSEEEIKNSVIVPIFMYDHSGISLSTTPFNCKWDSGMVGFIHGIANKVLNEQEVRKILIKEVDDYNDYLQNGTYEVEIWEDGEFQESHIHYTPDVQDILDSISHYGFRPEFDESDVEEALNDMQEQIDLEEANFQVLYCSYVQNDEVVDWLTIKDPNWEPYDDYDCPDYEFESLITVHLNRSVFSEVVEVGTSQDVDLDVFKEANQEQLEYFYRMLRLEGYKYNVKERVFE